MFQAWVLNSSYGYLQKLAEIIVLIIIFRHFSSSCQNIHGDNAAVLTGTAITTVA